MKKFNLSLISLFAALQFSYAQWTNATNIYNTNSGNVGVGTASPAQKFSADGNIHIQSSGTAARGFVFSSPASNWSPQTSGIYFAPRDGINATTDFRVRLWNGTGGADYRLLIDGANGNVFIKGSGNYAYNNVGAGELHIGYSFASAGTVGSVTRLALQPYGHVGGTWKFDARDTSNKAFLDIHYGPNVGLTMDHKGNVAIGATTPPTGYKFAVNGAAIATSMKVQLNADWPDFVFKKDYRLPALADVKTYIDQNQHLPDMPSADEAHKNGLDLGEMNRLLLKKVEELTLYLLEQQKQIDELKKQISNIIKP